MPDEKTQGGYATIFHNHLNHQVKKLTITARIDASQPKGMSVKALDQQAGRKPRPKSAQMEQHWVDKTYKTIADMSVRTQSMCLGEFICAFVDMYCKRNPASPQCMAVFPCRLTACSMDWLL
jgi:hypothetical protein